MIELADGGRVEVVDHLGSDLTVVNAARVSFAKESAELVDADRRLIAYLARNGHWTPFGQPQVQLRIRMPIFVARQWFRHTVGVVRNETSRRYVDAAPEFWRPEAWRGRAESAKQGSSGPIDAQADATLVYGQVAEVARAAYHQLLALGVCPEQARAVLPVSTMTEFVETGSLAYYARLFGLRLDEHAQREVADYAAAALAIIRPLFPVSIAALLGETP